MIYLWAILYLTVVGITMNFLLIESRFPRRQTLLLFGTATVLLCGALVLTYFHLGLDTLVRTYDIPSTVATVTGAGGWSFRPSPPFCSAA